MSAHCSSSFSSSSSSSSPCLVVTNCDVCSVRSVLPSTESVRSISVPRRTSPVILWDQCSAPDLNCDIVGSVFPAGRRAPQGACGQDTGHIRTYKDRPQSLHFNHLDFGQIQPSYFDRGWIRPRWLTWVAVKMKVVEINYGRYQLRSKSRWSNSPMVEFDRGRKQSKVVEFARGRNKMVEFDCGRNRGGRDRPRSKSMFRAGPQLRYYGISVPCWTSTANLWDQCSAGPPLRSCQK